jgi:hypothetical protein
MYPDAVYVPGSNAENSLTHTYYILMVCGKKKRVGRGRKRFHGRKMRSSLRA